MASRALAIAAAMLRRLEGEVLHPYNDGTGVWTIGIGCTFSPCGVRVTANTPPLTPAQSLEWCEAALSKTAEGVDALVKVPLTDAARAALYSFAYNLGVGALGKSTLLRKLNAGDVAGAAEQFQAWVFAGGKKLNGLVTRREYERDVFLGKIIPPGSLTPAPAPPLPPAKPAPVPGHPTVAPARPTPAPADADADNSADDLNVRELYRIHNTIGNYTS